MRGQVRNQLHALQHNPVVIASVRQRMETWNETIMAQINEIEAELAVLFSSEQEEAPSGGQISAEQAWAETITRLQTLPGIGPITACWIVVATMNFTLCTTASQAAAYAGLAPMPRESGTSVHQVPVVAIVAMGDCGRPCTWQPSQQLASTPSSSHSMSGSGLQASRRKEVAALLHENCYT